MVVKQEEEDTVAATTAATADNNDANNNQISKTAANEDATNGGTANSDSELILIQDNAFTIKIQVPNLEPFELQVINISRIIH